MPGRGGISTVVVGFDGSAHARRAMAWLTRMKPSRGARAVVVSVVEPVRVPAMGMLPASVRARLGAEASALKAEMHQKARRAAEASARPLAKAGWRPRIEVREGVPVSELLLAVRSAHADFVVLGARGVSAAHRLMLGSVSAGVLKDCPVPVLVVK